MPKSWKTLLAAVVMAGGASSITIADEYVYEPVDQGFAPLPVFSWSGLYLGLHGGYRWAETDANFPRSTADNPIPPNRFRNTLSYDLDSAMGGGQLGFNHQYGSGWVVGLESDVSYGDKSDTKQFYRVDFDQPVTATLDWSGTVRARLGQTWGRSLIYVTGGFAWARLEVKALDFDNPESPSGVIDPDGSGKETETLTGWTIGAGYEQAFQDNLTFRFEYLYADYGTETYFGGRDESRFFPTKADLETHTVRVGLNWKLDVNPGAPAPLK